MHSQRLIQARFKHNDSDIFDPSYVGHHFNEVFVNIEEFPQQQDFYIKMNPS